MSGPDALYLPACVKEDQPGGNWQEWKEELSRDRQQQQKHENSRYDGLDERSWVLYDAEREDTEYREQEVLCIIV